MTDVIMDLIEQRRLSLKKIVGRDLRRARAFLVENDMMYLWNPEYDKDLDLSEEDAL